MSVQAVLLPLFVQVTLTFVLLFWMATMRTGAIRRKEVRMRDIALRESAWSVKTTQVANAYHNQLELPLLFYVLTILALVTKQADLLFIVLAWVFVLLRLVHAVIHTTTNNVQQRGPVFGLGAVVLVVMWVIFIVRILFVLG
jgi:hypothetical protein